MDDPSSPLPSGESAKADSADSLFRAAEQARQRHLWEVAIRSYQAALRAQPNYLPCLLGLGHAYQGKSRDKDGAPFLHMALDQYRKAVRCDPQSLEAHDALLAASAKAHHLEDLLGQYQSWLEKDPDNVAYRATIKKIQTLLLMETDRTLETAPEPHRMTSFLLNKGLPLFGLIFLFGFIFGFAYAKQHSSPPVVYKLAIFSLRFSLFSFLAYAVFKLMSKYLLKR